MRYTPEIEAMILGAVEENPDREIVLPDWAYWEGVDTPWIYVDQMPTRLVVVLYERVIGALPRGAGLARQPGTSPRDINPHHWTPTPTGRARAYCPTAGHEYGPDDWIEGVGHRCQACLAAKRLAKESKGPSPADINREKTHCPQNHEYTPENTTRLRSGRRRCKTCAREQQARYAAKKKGSTE